MRFLIVAVAGTVLGLTATVALADVLGSGAGGLKAAAPRSDVEKVHEEHGGVSHGGNHETCYFHKAPGAYPDCHLHVFENGQWWVRRRKPDGTNCPTDCTDESGQPRRVLSPE